MSKIKLKANPFVINLSEDEKKLDERFGERRKSWVTTFAEDCIYGKKGDIAQPILVHMTKRKEKTSYTTPSPPALHLNIAIKCSKEAHKLHSKLEFKILDEKRRNIKEESLSDLYDYFEKNLQVIAFCFMAIEAYCNELIDEKLIGTYNYIKKNEPRELNASEVQRQISTEDKLDKVIPTILNIKSIKKTDIWCDFLTLKKYRDSIIHHKSIEHLPNSPPKNDIFSYMLERKPISYITTPIEVIEYYESKLKRSHRWLRDVRNKFEASVKELGLEA